MDTESATSQPTRPSPNQLVAFNMAFYRKAAGMLQEELAGELRTRTSMPWSKVSVSAAERSWDGDRPKHFDATQLLALADIFGVPITAFLLPPVEASTDNWALRPIRGAGGKKAWEISMLALLRCLYHVADNAGPTARAYQERQKYVFGNLNQDDARPSGDLWREKQMSALRDMNKHFDALKELAVFLSQTPADQGDRGDDALEDA